MDDIILSILVPTYGHEKYIKETLDSILMQKTNYKYEVIVGEDASPDNTREILKEYERQFPEKFRMVYRDVNAGGQGNGNSIDLVTRARGKYLAFVEGDDYWISDSKIEEQIDFLEKNPEYVAVSCNSIIVDANSEIIDEKYPECKARIYKLKHYRRNILPGQTASMVYRTDICKEIFSDIIWNSNPMPGDRVLFLGAVSKGKIYCMQKVMSAYRHIVIGGTSYSASKKRDFYKELEWWKELIAYSSRLNNLEAERAVEGRYLAFLLFEGFFKRELNLKELYFFCTKMKHKGYVFTIKWIDLLHKMIKER